jgi:hypothetical protein
MNSVVRIASKARLPVTGTANSTTAALSTKVPCMKPTRT